MTDTNRRIWTGVIAGVLAAAVLLTVGAGAYRAGQDDEVVTRVVEEGRTGEVVRVVGDHYGRPGFGFILFPLIIILVVVLLFRAFGSHRHGGWHGGWRYGGGPGWHGPGPGPCGPGSGPGEPGSDPRTAWFDELHRRSHERTGSGSGSASSEAAPSSEPGSGESPPPTPAQGTA
jgi:hypothetical protein